MRARLVGVGRRFGFRLPQGMASELVAMTKIKVILRNPVMKRASLADTLVA
jgi:hypothetical protein